MDPMITLIQLTLRVEREAEAQRQVYQADKVTRAEEKPLHLPKSTLRLRHAYTPLHYQPQCQCT